LPRPLATAVNRLLQIDKLDQLCRRASGTEKFASQLLEELEIEVQVSKLDLEKIPAAGGVIAVSNHPFGLLDGAILGHLLSTVRKDVRVLTNHMLGEVPELEPMGIFIDPFDRPECRSANSRALRQAIAHVKAGGMLLVFPAGEVAHFDFRSGAIRDPIWRHTTARMARMTGARVVPVLIRGANGIPFQMLGMVHPRLRTAALPTELLNKRGRVVEVRIGAVIEASQILALPSDEVAIKYLRLRTDLLARRRIATTGCIAPVRSISGNCEGEELAREIAGLPGHCLLEVSRSMSVYIAEASQILLILDEIGRLREMTFRAAGEGTGKLRDLDRFDPTYQHLFLWNGEKREIVGAYRIGDVPRILNRLGRKGLYTESLFRFRPGFLEKMPPAFEMGRSFIRPEYQRQFGPLLLLWKGIGAYVAQRPDYSTLIGAVSVSNQYSTASRELIAQYFDKNNRDSDHRDVKARRPLRGNYLEKWEMQALSSLLPDVDDLSARIADLEPDGKGIPVLVRQYVKLGGRLLAFSVDPQFANTLDGFVMVDLRQTARDILARYMGRDGAHSFLAAHAVPAPRVA
jgi:putative hemolysin